MKKNKSTSKKAAPSSERKKKDKGKDKKSLSPSRGKKSEKKAAKKASAPSATKKKAGSKGKKAATPKTSRAISPRRAYLKSSPLCRVTFSICEEAVADGTQVCLVGDFNGWDRAALPMRKLKKGGHSLTIKLATGRTYRFRYLIDGDRWENDWAADRYEPNPFGSDDSIIEI